MKLNKIFAVALAALTMTACSDDDKLELNTASGVTVAMEDATFTIGENVDIFNVPIEVTGEANGIITVTVQVKEGPANPDDPEHPTQPAKEDVNYIITSKTVNIPAGDKTFGIEIRNNWEQGVINDDYVFELTIVDVKGATLGAQKSTVVTIENVDDAYTMMCGKWTFTGEHLFNPVGMQTYTLTMKTPDPVEEAQYYGHELYAFGIRGQDFLYIPFTFAYDEDTEEISMELIAGDLCTTSLVNFTGLGSCALVAATEYNLSGFGENVPVTVPDFDHIVFDPTTEFFLAVMPYPALNSIEGYWGGWSNMTLERVK